MNQRTQRFGFWRRLGRGPRWLLLVVGAIVLLLVLVQLVASPVATALTNRRLASLEGHEGRVERVTVALWRGTLEVRDFVLRERGAAEGPPVVQVERASFTGALRPLLRGRLGGRGEVEGARLVVVKRASTEEPAEPLDETIKQAQRQARHWQAELSQAFPIQIEEIEMRDGDVRFVDLTQQPAVEVGIQKITMVARNLHNLPKYRSPPSTIDVTGLMSGAGRLAIHLRAEPMAQPLTFFSQLEVEELDLTQLETFMRAYAKVTVSSGRFSLYSEIDAQDGAYEGYVRPFFEDLEFEPVDEEEKGLVRRIVEEVADAATSLLQNPETEQVATETPFQGTFAENEADLWATVTNLLRNAFLDALRQGFGEQPSADRAGS